MISLVKETLSGQSEFALICKKLIQMTWKSYWFYLKNDFGFLLKNGQVICTLMPVKGALIIGGGVTVRLVSTLTCFGFFGFILHKKHYLFVWVNPIQPYSDTSPRRVLSALCRSYFKQFWTGLEPVLAWTVIRGVCDILLEYLLGTVTWSFVFSSVLHEICCRSYKRIYTISIMATLIAFRDSTYLRQVKTLIGILSLYLARAILTQNRCA